MQTIQSNILSRCLRNVVKLLFLCFLDYPQFLAFINGIPLLFLLPYFCVYFIELLVCSLQGKNVPFGGSSFERNIEPRETSMGAISLLWVNVPFGWRMFPSDGAFSLFWREQGKNVPLRRGPRSKGTLAIDRPLYEQSSFLGGDCSQGDLYERMFPSEGIFSPRLKGTMFPTEGSTFEGNIGHKITSTTY